MERKKELTQAAYNRLSGGARPSAVFFPSRAYSLSCQRARKTPKKAPTMTVTKVVPVCPEEKPYCA